MAPVLRNLLQKKIVVSISTAVGASLAGGFAWMYSVTEPKKKMYAEFYKNYDAEKVAKEMEAELARLGK